MQRNYFLIPHNVLTRKKNREDNSPVFFARNFLYDFFSHRLALRFEERVRSEETFSAIEFGYLTHIINKSFQRFFDTFASHTYTERSIPAVSRWLRERQGKRKDEEMERDSYA
jgi:hypothetical protein